MDKVSYCFYMSPIGELTLAGIGDELVLCEFERKDINGLFEVTPLLENAMYQLDEYFSKKRKVFDLKYRFIKGTDFQQRVWKALLTIPYGKTVSYKDIASMVESPKACQAIGQANHNNPISIFIPCHRVIGANGKMVGYGGGIDKKVFLLNLEKSNESEG